MPEKRERNNSMEISVIIPVYNKADYIEDCVKSLMGQDFADFEVVLVNDGSTDNSGEICDRLAEEHERIRVFHTENGGVTAARRHGYEQSQGRYIMFSDADDRIMPGALRIMHKAITDSGADEVIASFVNQHGRKGCSGLEGEVHYSVVLNNLLQRRNSFCVLWGVIFRRELLEGCLDTPRVVIEGEDILMQMKCLAKSPRVWVIPDVVYFYNEGLPNNRVATLEMIKTYDQELEKALSRQGGTFSQALIHHKIKIYETFLAKGQLDVFKAYYKPLRKVVTKDIPLAERIVIALPPWLAYILVRLRKLLK